MQPSAVREGTFLALIAIDANAPVSYELFWAN